MYIIDSVYRGKIGIIDTDDLVREVFLLKDIKSYILSHQNEFVNLKLLKGGGIYYSLVKPYISLQCDGIEYLCKNASVYIFYSDCMYTHIYKVVNKVYINDEFIGDGLRITMPLRDSRDDRVKIEFRDASLVVKNKYTVIEHEGIYEEGIKRRVKKKIVLGR